VQVQEQEEGLPANLEDMRTTPANGTALPATEESAIAPDGHMSAGEGSSSDGRNHDSGAPSSADITDSEGEGASPDDQPSPMMLAVTEVAPPLVQGPVTTIAGARAPGYGKFYGFLRHVSCLAGRLP